MVNRTSVLAPARRTAAAEAGEHDAARARTYRCKKQAVRRCGEAEEDDRKEEGRTGEEGEGRAQGEGAREEERHQGRAGRVPRGGDDPQSVCRDALHRGSTIPMHFSVSRSIIPIVYSWILFSLEYLVDPRIDDSDRAYRE